MPKSDSNPAQCISTLPTSASGSTNVQKDAEVNVDGLGFLVRHVHRAFARVLTERLASSGVSAAQWTILRALWREDRCSQVELAARVRVEKASLTQVLVSLERKGLIQRERSQEDRRRWYVCLTQAGRALKPQLLHFAAEIDQDATANLSDQEVASLKALLAKTLRNLE